MSESKTPFHNPFGALSALRGATSAPTGTGADSGEPTHAAVSREALDPLDESVTDNASPNGPRVPRAVVRLERSGRGGKEVTVIDHLGLGDDALRQWLKALKGKLGCGGTIERSAIVLQGDQRSRLPGLLTARGVKRVTVA